MRSMWSKFSIVQCAEIWARAAMLSLPMQGTVTLKGDAWRQCHHITMLHRLLLRVLHEGMLQQLSSLLLMET